METEIEIKRTFDILPGARVVHKISDQIDRETVLYMKQMAEVYFTYKEMNCRKVE